MNTTPLESRDIDAMTDEDHVALMEDIKQVFDSHGIHCAHCAASIMADMSAGLRAGLDATKAETAHH